MNKEEAEQLNKNFLKLSERISNLERNQTDGEALKLKCDETDLAVERSENSLAFWKKEVIGVMNDSQRNISFLFKWNVVISLCFIISIAVLGWVLL